MKIKNFKVEQWMNEYETKAKYNLAETCIDTMSVGELLDITDTDPEEFYKVLSDVRLTYGHIEGSPELKKGISGLYKNIFPEQIIPTHGAIGANYQVLMTIIEPTDNMVCVMPTYQQHYSIPESIGAEVRIIKLLPENKFVPDIKELEALVDQNTKLITINNPNNPTGALIPPDKMNEIVQIAKDNKAYILSDEVYRGISEDGSYMPSIVDLYEKGISVGSMSKIFSLAGLRLGWIVSKDKTIIDECMHRRDYDTISCGVLDDKVASLALNNIDKVFARNKTILDTSRTILDDWINSTPGVSYVKPVAGTTALVYYDKDISSYDLCVDLMEKKGLMFTPGSCFELEGCVRIGYAFDSALLQEGLKVFADYLQEY